MSIDDVNDSRSYEQWMNEMATSEPDGFDESNDGADRAAAFLESLVALMKDHHVTVDGALRECCFEHQFGERENWWQLDMYEVYTLTDGKAR